TDLYVYNIKNEILQSLKLMYFDSLTLEEKSETEYLNSKPLTLENLKLHQEQQQQKQQQQQQIIIKPTKPRSEIIKERESKVVLDDFAKYNEKRKLNGQVAVSEEEFEKIMDELSISGSEDDSDEEYYNNLNSNTLMDDDDDLQSSISFMNTKSPLVLFKSNLLPSNSCFGIYKTTLNLTSNTTTTNPLSYLTSLNETNKKSLASHKSALFMIGGGHFAGAIISHSPKSTKGNKGTTEELMLQSVHLLEQKTFHRYTTRRKQGGSQSANDNAKGKAKSAGSNLRRYNEQALTKEVRDLLNDWKHHLDSCDHIFIKANGQSSHKSIIGYLNAPIKNDDVRVKFFPFTTKRPTTTELKKAWCELSYLKIVNVPKINKDILEKLEKQKEALVKSKQQHTDSHKEQDEVDPDVKVTLELISLLKKGKAPALISYLNKNKIDVNFNLKPINEYMNTPTMLHYASFNGLHHICQILLINLKANPTIMNKFGKTAYELSNNTKTQYSFQLASFTIGNDTVNFNWINDAKVPIARSKDEIDKIEKLELDKLNEEKQKIIQKSLNDAKKQFDDEKIKKFGKGKPLLPNKQTEQTNLNTLTPEQRMKVMREQRARAAEARLKK
ncbi:hypothetical protein CANARDRAFT_190087, partial [[Candida] arabinofermentans NRRL YB-2248]